MKVVRCFVEVLDPTTKHFALVAVLHLPSLPTVIFGGRFPEDASSEVVTERKRFAWIPGGDGPISIEDIEERKLRIVEDTIVGKPMSYLESATIQTTLLLQTMKALADGTNSRVRAIAWAADLML